MKKVFAIMLAVLFAAVLTIPAAAASNSTVHSITITNADPAKSHTYEAYRVFEGNLDTAENILSDIEWSSGVNSDELINDLKNSLSDFNNCASARDVAAIIANYGDNADDLDAFAAVVGKHLADVSGTSNSTSSPYIISVTGDGYYFIKDKNDTVTDNGETYSKYMLNVVRDVSIEAKDEHLVPEKKIFDNDTLVSSNSASIGDEIKFQVQIDIPKMDGYKSYIFAMKDTLSKGLEFQKIDSVKVGTASLTADEGYTLTKVKNDDGTTSLTIDFNNFINYKGTSGKVTVVYTAVLDTDAVVGGSGNTNTVNFKYSNDPYSVGKTGITPSSETNTFTTAVNILKVDGADNTKLLKGAKFKIEGEGVKTIITTGSKFEKAPYTAADNETADEDKYYLLENGTYTKTAPEPLPADSYVLVHFTQVTTKDTAVDCEGVTDVLGTTNFNGLNAGAYTITEIEAPDGYNLLDQPIDFTVTWNGDNGFSVNTNNQNNLTYDANTKTFNIKIENNAGSVLPHTGGIGTSIFRVTGGILVIGAAVFLVSVIVTRRRENKGF